MYILLLSDGFTVFAVAHSVHGIERRKPSVLGLIELKEVVLELLFLFRIRSLYVNSHPDSGI